jgi:dihydroorotase
MSDKMDLLLKGGHVIDPANEIDERRDVGIKDGRIARVEADIPQESAVHCVDVANLVLTPGLLDIHVHCYSTRNSEQGGYSGSINADAHLLKEGVTTCADAGTSGADELEHFRRTVIERSCCRILAFVNIAPGGMGSSAAAVDPEQDPSLLDAQRCAEVIRDHREIAVGVKTAHYRTSEPFDADHPPWASVDRAVEAGTRADTPVMVDFWPRPPQRSYADLLLEHLRSGDIHIHVFARQFPIVDAEGRVLDHLLKARERGIHFDLGHGAASFWYRNAAQAYQEGFAPDSISTDLHMGNIHGSVNSMLDVMSKCLAMRMPIQETIYRSTVMPARAIGHPQLGTLSVGAEADVAVLAVLEDSFSYRDCGWARLDGDYRLECAMTLRAGEIVFDRHGLSCPHWQEVPADTGYWDAPPVPVPVSRLWADGPLD